MQVGPDLLSRPPNTAFTIILYLETTVAHTGEIPQVTQASVFSKG